MEDVVAFLDELKFAEIELTAAGGIGSPGVEVSPVGEVVVDEPSEDAGDKGVAVAMALQVAPDILRGAGDAAGAEELLGLRRAEAGETLAENTGYGLAGGIEQDAGNEPRGQEELRRRGSSEGAEEVVVLGTDGFAATSNS